MNPDREEKNMFRRILIVFPLLMTVAVACLLQSQVAYGSEDGHGMGTGALKMEFTATDDWFPSGDPGQTFCPGGEFTGDLFQPCPPGTNIHIRDAIGQSWASGDDPRFDGILTYTVNGNLKADFTGPVWGTWTLEVEICEGIWDGVWSGQRTLLPDQPGLAGMGTWIGNLRLTGHGHGACVDGLQMKGTEIIITYTPLPIAYEMFLACDAANPCSPEGILTGKILEPGRH